MNIFVTMGEASCCADPLATMTHQINESRISTAAERHKSASVLDRPKIIVCGCQRTLTSIVFAVEISSWLRV